MIDGASVTILPRRAPVGNSAPIRGHTLAVFARAPSEASGVPATHFAATVEPDGQAGFAIPDLDESGAVELGRALGLPEILFWDGRRAQLLACSTIPAQ